MIDEREIVRRAVEGLKPPGPALDRLLRRRDRHQRNQRIAAGIVGIAVALAVLVGGVSLLRSSPQPATTVSPTPDLPLLLQPGEFLDQDFSPRWFTTGGGGSANGRIAFSRRMCDLVPTIHLPRSSRPFGRRSLARL